MEFHGEITVRRTRYVSDQTGWAVVERSTRTAIRSCSSARSIHLEERERARVIGTWVDDSRYGLQVKVSEAHPLPPSDVRRSSPTCAASSTSAQARRDARRALRPRCAASTRSTATPRRTFAAVGLRRRRTQEAAASWLGAARDAAAAPAARARTGSATSCARIHEEYGATAHRVVRERPYELTSVFGVGFLIADRIARAPRHPGRPPRADPCRRAAHCSPRPSAAAAPACRSTRSWRRSLSCSASRSKGAHRRARSCDGHLVARRATGSTDAQTAELEAELAERVDMSWSAARPCEPASGSRWPRPRRHRADRRAARGRSRRVRPSPVADHRRARHRQDGVDQDDRRDRGRPGRQGAAGGPHRPRGDPDERGQRHRAPRRSTRHSAGSRARARPTTRTIRCAATC